jgi:hypothetical protein
MEQRCHSLLFAAHRFDSYNDRKRADDIYLQIRDSYPGDEPSGCRRKIEGIVVDEPRSEARPR